ncbi:MAG TPA: M50 family metallopeptidase [Thermoanaerobaculia bacterium]
MTCPKCGAPRPEDAVECLHCGVIFAKWQQAIDFPVVVRPPKRSGIRHATLDDDVVTDGRLGPYELKILGFGLIAAIVVYALTPLRFIFSLLVTLFHELGHAVAGWIFGYPSLPAFDFVYGGGLTHYGTFHLSIALAMAGLFGWAIWTFRERRRWVVILGTLFVVWLIIVSAEWRRELAMASAGHAFEFILAGIFFYQALAGVGWRMPEIERPLGAFVAFFVQIHSSGFAWRLTRDADFLSWYREGKGGALMNDLEVVALDLHIHTPLNPGIIGVARWLLVFSFVPTVVALLWYFQRRRWHRALAIA